MTDPLREAAQAVVDEYDNEPTYPRRSAYFFTALRPHIDALRAALRSTPAAPRCNCNGENERPRGHVSTCPLWTPNPFATPAAPQPDYQIIDKGGSNMEVRFAKVAHPSPADAPAPQSLRDALVKFVTGEGAMATDPDGDCYFCEAEGVDFELPFHPGADPDHAGEHEDWCLVPIARAALDAPALTTPQSLRDSLIATLEASEQPPVIEGLLDVRRAIDLAGLHESIEVYGDVSVDEMEASCIVLIDNAIDALRAALRSTPAAPQPDPFTAQTIHAAQDRMLRDPGTRWITDDDGHTEKFIPATVALRETNRMRPDSPAYVAPQPDTAPSHPSPGESAGFDAEVAALAAIIHARNDHTGPVQSDCEAMAEHLTAFGYRVQPDTALTVERLARARATDGGWKEPNVTDRKWAEQFLAILRALGEGVES